MLSDGMRRLSQADLLLGSFFFIHESRSRAVEDSADSGMNPAAFEFLHRTLGEFLAADFILRQVIAEANTISVLAGDATLGDTLRQRLGIMRESWFACLIASSLLHTRPVILSMLKEWGGHRLVGSSRSRADLLNSLDMIVAAQLQSLLTETTFPELPSKGRDAPYRQLPVSVTWPSTV